MLLVEYFCSSKFFVMVVEFYNVNGTVVFFS